MQHRPDVHAFIILRQPDVPNRLLLRPQCRSSVLVLPQSSRAAWYVGVALLTRPYVCIAPLPVVRSGPASLFYGASCGFRFRLHLPIAPTDDAQWLVSKSLEAELPSKA